MINRWLSWIYFTYITDYYIWKRLIKLYWCAHVVVFRFILIHHLKPVLDEAKIILISMLPNRNRSFQPSFLRNLLHLSPKTELGSPFQFLTLFIIIDLYLMIYYSMHAQLISRPQVRSFWISAASGLGPFSYRQLPDLVCKQKGCPSVS